MACLPAGRSDHTPCNTTQNSANDERAFAVKFQGNGIYSIISTSITEINGSSHTWRHSLHHFYQHHRNKRKQSYLTVYSLGKSVGRWGGGNHAGIIIRFNPIPVHYSFYENPIMSRMSRGDSAGRASDLRIDDLRFKPLSGAQEKLVSFVKSKMLCWLAVGVPNPRLYTHT